MEYRKKIVFIGIYILGGILLILFFILGRVSMYWNDMNTSSITGITFESSDAVSDFVSSLEDYSGECTNEIEVFYKIQDEVSQKNSQFIASSRGKYYYEVGSKKANGLSEKSRVYFQTESEAISHGYVKGN